MSYARWGRDSDVYVFLDVSGRLECCACSLNRGRGAHFALTEAILDHLGEHRRVGHRVPQYCVDGLRADREENDAEMAG